MKSFKQVIGYVVSAIGLVLFAGIWKATQPSAGDWKLWPSWWLLLPLAMVIVGAVLTPKLWKSDKSTEQRSVFSDIDVSDNGGHGLNLNAKNVEVSRVRANGNKKDGIRTK